MVIIIVLFAIFIVPVAVADPELPTHYDVMINDALVVDGSGSPGFHADIGIVGDRIEHIRPHLDPARARRVIQAAGMVAAPGFVEPHSHISNIHEYPDAENFLRQGVTTLANTLHSLEQPHPLGAYIDALTVAPNTVWSTGHSWIRERVLGTEDRAPSADERATMEALVKAAMNDGAIGLATGLEYVPANYATTEEVIALARAAKRPGAIYATHLRDEGGNILAAVDEALEVGGQAGMPVHINHLKITGRSNWESRNAVLDRLEKAWETGLRVSYDVYPYTAYSTYSYILFPQDVMASGRAALKQLALDPVAREHLADAVHAQVLAQTSGDLDSIIFRDLPGHEGQSLRQYLRERQKPETLEAGVQALIDLEVQGGFIGVFHAMSEHDVLALIRHPMGSVSSDGDLVNPGEGFPHPRSYGAFARVLAHYVRASGALSLEQAVHKMSWMNARALNLHKRGVIGEGWFADLVLFDAGLVEDRATYQDPHRYATGIDYVIINGKLVLDQGELTGERPGRVLKLLAPD